MSVIQPQSNHLYQDKNPIAVGNQVSVEKEMYISTGVVSYVEGDILEIELAHAKLYEAGEPVKLTVYSTRGFQILYSSVIALDDGILTVFNPPDNQRLSSRRHGPRIEVEDTGRIRALRDGPGGVDLLSEPRGFELRNLSTGGVGFVLKDPAVLRIGLWADIELDIVDGLLPCSVEITRRQALGGGQLFIGAKYVELDNEHLNTLRGYILRIQIKNRARERRNTE